MPALAPSPTIAVRRSPPGEAKPYVRAFYGQLRTDADPVLDREPDFTACAWYACSIDGDPVGGFLLVPDDRGETEVLTLLVRPARGGAAVDCARAALAAYRADGGGRLVACAYSDDRAAQLFITAVGFRRVSTAAEGASRHGRRIHAIYYEST